jgi:hypothetical protein
MFASIRTNMHRVTYYKLGQTWFLDLPEYLEQGGDPDHLERIGSFAEFLDLASGNASTIIFEMDMEPFEGASVFELTGSSGGRTGGYYHLSEYEGKRVDFELWFNTIIYIRNTELPKRLYLKKLK